MSGLALISALILLSPAAGPPADPPWMVQVGLTKEQLEQRTDTLRAKGYRPVGISAYNSVEANRFAVIYQKSKGPAWEMEWNRTPDEFLRRARNLFAKGYSPICLSGCNQIGAERLADLWLKRKGADREITRGLDAAGLLREAKRMRSRGFRPLWISSYMVNAANTYAVIQEKSTVEWELKYGMSVQGLRDALDDYSTRGYRPVSIGGLNAGGVVRYCAVWEKRKGPAWQVFYGQSQNGLLDQARAMSAQGYRPVAVTGYNTLDGDRFASIWEKETGR